MKYKLLGRSSSAYPIPASAPWALAKNGTGVRIRHLQQIFDTYANAGGNFLDTAN